MIEFEPIEIDYCSQPARVVLDPDCDLSPLIVAVILQAKREARRGDPDAGKWLIGEGQVWLDAIMDIHPDKIKQWASGNYKPLGWKRKRPKAHNSHRKPRKSPQEALHAIYSTSP